MASYIDNIAANSQIAQVLPFTPDWQFLSSAQQTLSQMQTQAFDSFASKYSTYLKSGLSREDTTAFRENFLKEADAKIKMVSGTDLTDPRNLQSANSIFDGLASNKLYAADIMFSKQIQKGLETANNFKTSPDAAGRALYNPYSERLMMYSQMDFTSASPEEALNMRAPGYVPGVDFRTLSKRVLDDYGMNVEYDQINGGYVYTYQNGEMVQPHMKEAITRELMKDPAVNAYQNTKTSAEFRDQTESLMSSGLSKDQAELQVANRYIMEVAMMYPEGQDIGIIKSYIDNDFVVKEHERRMAERPYAPGSAEERDYKSAKARQQSLASAKESVDERTAARSAKSPKEIISFAKNLKMNSDLNQEFDAQASSFALKNAKIKIGADDLAKAQAKGAGQILSSDYADYVETAPGGQVSEKIDWAVEDARQLVKESTQVTDFKRDAIKMASLMDVPEMQALTKDVDVDGMSDKDVMELYNKVNDAFKASEVAQSSDIAPLYIQSVDAANDSYVRYTDLVDDKRNNNEVIVQQLISGNEYGANFLLDENGRIRSEAEFNKLLGLSSSSQVTAPESKYGRYTGGSFYESFNPYGAENIEVGSLGKPNVYKNLIDKFKEVYNFNIRKAESPITSVYAKVNKLDEGKNFQRVSFLYDQKVPESSARQLALNMYDNLAKAPEHVIAIGDVTGDENIKTDETAKDLVKGVLRKILIDDIPNKESNRTQYQISFQDAAFGDPNLAAYVIKFVDPSKIKEFLGAGATDEQQAVFQKMITGGITVVMEDKNMVNRLPELSQGTNATAEVFRANGNKLEETFPGYGTLRAVAKSDNTVILSGLVQGEYALSDLQEIYRTVRNSYYRQRKELQQQLAQ